MLQIPHNNKIDLKRFDLTDLLNVLLELQT